MRLPRRLSDNAWSLTAAATRLAHERDAVVAPEHMLLAMTRTPNSVAVGVLMNLVDLTRARAVLERELDRQTSSTAHEPADSRWSRLIARAELQGAPVCSEHLLLALAGEAVGLASSVLQVHGATIDAVHSELWVLFGAGHGIDLPALRLVIGAPRHHPLIMRFRPKLQDLMQQMHEFIIAAEYERAAERRDEAANVRRELIACARE